jgi:Effector-associated domain 1/NB-ARC domain
MDLEQATRILDEAELAERLIASAETERLAVLATFNPDRLAHGDGPEILRLLCEWLARRDEIDEAILTERYRVSALTEMLRRGGMDELRRVRGAVKPDYQTPLQQVFDAFVANGDLPDDLSGENDLLAALEVQRWVSLALAQAGSKLQLTLSRDELESRLALLNVTRPVRRLVAGGFVGRETELERLHAYRTSSAPPSLTENPPMVVYGIGGIGKSTLVARFVMDLHEVFDQDESGAWAYVDLDRPTLASGDPMVVVTDIIEQVSAQFPTKSRLLRRLLDVATMRSKGSGLEVADFIGSPGARAEQLAEALRAIKVGSLVVVIDTFEGLERRNPERATELRDLFATLAATLPAFRLVVSGRGPARIFVSDTRPDRLLEVGPLTDDAAVRLLRHFVDQAPTASGTDVDDTLAREVISLVGGIPLTVRLAATVLVREGPTAITDAATRARALDQVRTEVVRGFLYRRILDHIRVPDPDRTELLRKVARAGLALRWITPELIERVLIPAIEVSPAPDAAGLFADLAAEVALAERDGDVLRLREELRGPALAALALDDPLMVEHVHQEAADYFTKDHSPESAVEYAYHRLALGDRVFWLDSAILARLDPSIADLPAASAALIQRAKADDPRPLTEAKMLAASEQEALYEADAALRAGHFDRVAELLSDRSDHTEGSELHRIESRLWEALGDLGAAIDAARRDVAAATAAANPTRLAAAAIWLCGLQERTHHPVDAAAGLQATADAHLLAGHPELRLEVLLNRMNLMERAGILSEEDRWTSGLRVRALLQRGGPAKLSANTAIVRLCGAALGAEEPARLRAAALAVGLGHDEDPGRVGRLITEIAAWDAAQPEPGSLARALDLRTATWSVLAGLGTDAGPLLNRLWATAKPPEPVREALRAIYLWWGIRSEPAAESVAGTPFLIGVPVDWSRPEAKELEDILVTAYPRSGDIMELAARSGIDMDTINWSRPNRIATRELVTQAALSDNLDSLIATVVDDRAAASMYPRIVNLVGQTWLAEHDINPDPGKGQGLR